MIVTEVAHTPEDYAYLVANYKDITEATFNAKYANGEYMVIRENAKPFGWLRWGYFWDSLPFMNMLWLDEAQRDKGYGRQFVMAWEAHMQSAGHEAVLTSTQSDEQAQHFYRKIGYEDRGALLLPGVALEIIFYKRL